MAQPVAETNFSAGEISPSLYSRVDLAKYHTGLKLCRNFFVDFRGGVSNRAGTRYVDTCLAPTSGPPPRLIPFQFSIIQTYVLEFGDHYMRVIKDGGYVIDPSTFGVYTASTPWAIGDVRRLKFTQNADVLTITHPSYPPYDVTRTGHAAWTFTAVDFSPVLYAPGGLQGGSSSAGSVCYGYVITAVDSKGNESRPSARYDVVNAVNMGATAGNVIVAWGAVTGASYYNVYRTIPTYGSSIPQGASLGFLGSTTGVAFNDTNIVPDFSKGPPLHLEPFAPGGLASVTVNAPGSGIPDNASVIVTDSTGSGAEITPIISGGALSGLIIKNPGKGYTNPVVSLSAGANYGITSTVDPLTGTYPGVVAYFQQRKTYASSMNNPSTFWMSKTGLYRNFDKSDPVQDADAITGTLASNQVNEIRSLLSMPSGLIAVTGGGAWQMSGGAAGQPVTPKTITATPQAYTGISYLDPIVINYDILYVQNLGSIVRDLSYNFYANVYTGVDMTILSNHFFFKSTITAWAYADIPWKIIWCVRDDGALLSFTYLKEQDVYGWALHTSPGGLFQDAVSIPEANESSVYFVVRRTLNGQDVYVLEQMASRSFLGTGDQWFLDCALDYLGEPTTNLTGLDHLEGQSVLALATADTSDVLSTQIVGPFTVTGGAIDLPFAVQYAIVGLPYIAMGQTLSLEPGGGGTVQGKRKFSPQVVFRVQNTTGLKAGPAFDDLTDVEQDSPDFTGDLRHVMGGDWNNEATVCWQTAPGLAATITGIFPEVDVGDTP